jgi:hypothetical protein
MPKRKHTARSGLERLAFGNAGDALDLFCVSELKSTEKGIEIKFFDRLKALEALLALEADNESPGAALLYKALAASAANPAGAGDCDEA